jgi:FeS assembly SUF system protein
MTNHATEQKIIAALRKVHDPEIPVNIYDLGLIYELGTDDAGNARITMTLTAPNCPVADDIVADVQRAVASIEGINNAEVNLTFTPPWSTEKMTDVARLELQAMGVDPDRAKQSLVNRPTGLTVERRPSR